MSDPYTMIRGTSVPTRRRQLRLWMSLGLDRIATALSGALQRTSLSDALRNPHLARDIGRETDAREPGRTQDERLRQRTLW